MAKTLLRIVETWKVDTEAEAAEVIAQAIETGGELTKKTVELKQKKKQGEIIAEALKVSLQIDYEGFWDDLDIGGKDE